MPTFNAVDMSKWGGELTDLECQAMKLAGVKTVLIATGPGGYGTGAHQQAMSAHKNGLRVEAYYFLEFGSDPKWWIKAGYEALGEATAYVERVWIDVEDVVNPKPSDPNGYVYQGIAAAMAWYSLAEVGVYSGAWYWRDPKYMNNTEYFKDFQLWNAWYDDDPDVDGLPYGGWTKDSVAIEQFGGTQFVGGQSVDVNYIYKFPRKNYSSQVDPIEEEDVTKTEELNEALVKRFYIASVALGDYDKMLKVYELLKANGY